MRDLNSIVSANADSFIPQQTVKITVGQLEALHAALGTATASLVDVLKYGTNRNQRKNINNSDLPIIGKATELAAGLLAQVEKGFVGAFSYTDQWGNQIDLGPGIVTTRALTEEEKGDWAKKHAKLSAIGKPRGLGPDYTSGRSDLFKPGGVVEAPSFADSPMETRLDRPLNGADSPYAEERAQARFDAIEDARVSAKAQEAAQEAADNEAANNPTLITLVCVTCPNDFLMVSRRQSAGGFQFRLTEQDQTVFADIDLDGAASLTKWLNAVLANEDAEDYDVPEFNLDTGGANLCCTSYGYEGKIDLIVKGGGNQTWVTLDSLRIDELLEFINA
tara:strand:- start:35024 stop:36025 length:1002 start_codon:yes stop_codon:yes gene_type:complete